MLDSDEFQAAIEEIHDEEDTKELIDKVASLLLHYGMYRHSESSQIESQDATLDDAEDIDAKFPHPTKKACRRIFTQGTWVTKTNAQKIHFSISNEIR